MQDRESAGPATPENPDSPDAARAKLASALRISGRAIGRSVQDAFARVPRHIFVPEVGAAAAYRDEAFVIKCGADGLPISSSSQPAMMAIMIDQLGLEPGHRVLEIGTGSGYNAAVMATVVGSSGHVATMDIDAELVSRARSSLLAGGYDAVVVTCGDGGYGDPGAAPFDRIIVTAGAWDVAPAWLEQLGPSGRLVLPLSIRGIQLSIGLQRRGDGWLSTSACRCGFVRMLGAFAGPEHVVRLDGPRALFAQMADGVPADAAGLQEALAGPVTDVIVTTRDAALADLADLDLWLTVTQPDLDRITVLAAPGGWLPLAQFLPFGGLVSNATRPDQLGVAVLLPGEAAGRAGRPNGLVVRGYGPGGADLAALLADQVPAWADLGRPGAADLYISAIQSRTADDDSTRDAPAGLFTIKRPSVELQLGWPAV